MIEARGPKDYQIHEFGNKRPKAIAMASLGIKWSDQSSEPLEQMLKINRSTYKQQKQCQQLQELP